MKPPIRWRVRMWLLTNLLGYKYLEDWLDGLRVDKQFFFVQIGANDGQRHDPINKYIKEYSWRGILVEPQKAAFQRLVSNYQAHSGLIFENVAIAEQDGEIELYSVESKNSEEWHDLIATVRPEHGMLKDLNVPIQKTSVKAIRLETLWSRHGVSYIDLLLMDLEGYEPKLLKSYSWNIKPKKIYFETRHLGYMEFQEVQQVLNVQGYRLFIERGDCLAWLE